MANAISEITSQEVADYIRLDEASPSDLQQIGTFIAVAKSYVRSATGLTVEEMDSYADLIIAVYVLCQDMYDNRSYYIDSQTNVNKVVDSILNMHRRNFLPNANSRFVAIADELTTTDGVAVSLNPITNDAVPFGSIVTAINDATPVTGTPLAITNATVTLNADGTLTILPSHPFTGAISFEYTVTAPDKTIVTSTVAVVVSEAV